MPASLPSAAPAADPATAGGLQDSAFSLLLSQIEQSLRSTQVAWITADADATEQCTREQAALCRQLKKFLTSRDSLGPASLASVSLSQPECQPQPYAREWVEEMRAAARRVPHLARVQAALLYRSRRFLGVLSNWMAGPGAIYDPPRAGSAVSVNAGTSLEPVS
jgi:hypothetical protein